jgi:hypothetical protein
MLLRMGRKMKNEILKGGQAKKKLGLKESIQGWGFGQASWSGGGGPSIMFK